jgi:hypothetical protein
MSDALSVIILAQVEALDDRHPINSDFVLLDSQLMVDLFLNLKHVQNICPAQLPIKDHCNKGTMSTTEVADFGNMEVHVNKDGIASVLSLFYLCQKSYLPRCQECFLIVCLHPLHQRPLPPPQHLTQTGHSLLRRLFKMLI